MRLWVDAALSILLAPSCAACTEPLEHPTHGAVCVSCWRAIVPVAPPWCERCGDRLPHTATRPSLCPRCASRPLVIDATRSVGIYDGALRAIIHALKYDGRRSLARPLATLMRSCGEDVIERADAIVAVPLHRARHRERGFNQAEDLAQSLGLPVVRALARSRPTAVQADLAGDAREANVSGAFVATRHASRIAGQRVVLVDDVCTTGATLNACAAALRTAGARSVGALTAARAVTQWR